MLTRALTRSSATLRRSIYTLHQNKQIFLHPAPNNSTKLSFAKDASKLAIGLVNQIPPDALANEDAKPGPDNFEPNSEFLDLLHDTIAKTVHEDFTYLMESKAFADQHMPIYDLRSPPEFQRIPEIEDTFGFVAVDSKGNVDQSSYEKNGFYKLVTADGLVVKLSDDLLEKMKQELGE